MRLTTRMVWDGEILCCPGCVRVRVPVGMELDLRPSASSGECCRRLKEMMEKLEDIPYSDSRKIPATEELYDFVALDAMRYPAFRNNARFMSTVRRKLDEFAGDPRWGKERSRRFKARIGEQK